jgi:hypothetical protein
VWLADLGLSRQNLSRRELFIDVDAIKPGIDFVKQLDTQVSQCDVMLALIGRSGWVSKRSGRPFCCPAGQPRNRTDRPRFGSLGRKIKRNDNGDLSCCIARLAGESGGSRSYRSILVL